MDTSIARRTAVALLCLAWACGGAADEAEETEEAPAAVSAQDQFFAQLESMCGQAYEGEATLISGDGFDGRMVMHVRRCSPNEIQIPLHVGENRSRTWIVTRTEEGLRLKHDHRHEDGSEDAVTQYGGDTRDVGTATTQAFPADAFTAELIPEAATNVWSLTVEPGERLTYHLTRNGEPRATFTFDLSRTVEAPPAPWGYEGG